MSKAEIDALGKVYANEVERSVGPRKHDFPFQSKAAIYKRLIAGGLLEARTVYFGDAPLTVRIDGYELTHAGRMLYCMSCGDAPDRSMKDSPPSDTTSPSEKKEVA